MVVRLTTSIEMKIKRMCERKEIFIVLQHSAKLKKHKKRSWKKERESREKCSPPPWSGFPLFC
jgi:hypothetical protein